MFGTHTRPASVIPGHPGYRSARWYACYAQAQAALSSAANRVKAAPFLLQLPVTIAKLGCRVATGATGNVQLALYRNSGGLPGALIDKTASIDISATGAVNAALSGGNVTLQPGWYWACANFDAAVSMQMLGATQKLMTTLTGSGTQTEVNGTSGLATGLAISGAVTFGTWAADHSASNWGSENGGQMPAIEFLTA